MNYIWNDYSMTIKYKVDDENISPYMEDMVICVNHIRYINPLIRFEEIFSPLLEMYDNTDVNSDTIHAIENIILHYLAQLDRKTGIHKFSIVEFIIEQEIMEGVYGEFVSNIYKLLQEKEKSYIKNFLRLHNASDGCKSYFNEIVQLFFRDTKCYFYKDEDIILLYLPHDENKIFDNGVNNHEKLQLLIELFLDVTVHIRVFWQYPFGIIGRDETMGIDNIAIY